MNETMVRAVWLARLQIDNQRDAHRGLQSFATHVADDDEGTPLLSELTERDHLEGW